MKLIVADVFTVSQGLVVTGRVAHGVIATGDRLWLRGGGEPVAVVVRGMKDGFCPRGDPDRVSAGLNVALRIDGVEADAVRPGMWLSETRSGGDRPPLP